MHEMRPVSALSCPYIFIGMLAFLVWSDSKHIFQEVRSLQNIWLWNEMIIKTTNGNDIIIWRVRAKKLPEFKKMFIRCDLYQSNLILSVVIFYFFWPRLLFQNKILICCSGTITALCSLDLLGSSDPPSLVSQVVDRHVPPHPANFSIYCRDRVSLWCPGWTQAPEFKWSSHLNLPKCWDYRCEPPHPALVYFINVLMSARCLTGSRCSVSISVYVCRGIASELAFLSPYVHTHFGFVKKTAQLLCWKWSSHISLCTVCTLCHL